MDRPTIDAEPTVDAPEDRWTVDPAATTPSRGRDDFDEWARERWDGPDRDELPAAAPAFRPDRSIVNRAAGSRAGRRVRAGTRGLTRRTAQAIRAHGATVAGLGCLVAAAFTFAVWAGLVAAGAALLALDWHIRE